MATAFLNCKYLFSYTADQFHLLTADISENIDTIAGAKRPESIQSMLKTSSSENIRPKVENPTTHMQLDWLRAFITCALKSYLLASTVDSDLHSDGKVFELVLYLTQSRD